MQERWMVHLSAVSRQRGIVQGGPTVLGCYQNLTYPRTKRRGWDEKGPGTSEAISLSLPSTPALGVETLPLWSTRSWLASYSVLVVYRLALYLGLELDGPAVEDAGCDMRLRYQTL